MRMLSFMAALGCGTESTVSAVSTGLGCWDLSGDGVADDDEDTNGDGAWDALDCQGSAGEDGAIGPAGESGAAGAGGLSCWDLSGDGVADDNEDTNGDGAWDALDCQGSAGEDGAGGDGALEKGALYAVSGSSGSSSSAACEDTNDIMLTGGCSFQESCIPAYFTGYPRYNDDDSQTADWYCALNCGTVVASGFCLTIDGP